MDYVTRKTLEEKLGKDAEKRQKAYERKYEANKGEDIIDHLSKDWKLIGMSDDIRVYEGRKAMAAYIMRPTRTRKPIESPVGHISLDFHPDDTSAMTDKRMAEIVFDYIKQMGFMDTPFVVVRHYDKAHPHCHLVFSRVDNKGKILSQTTNFKKNERVCKRITEKARRPGDMYETHYWIWHDFRTGKPQYSFDPPKNRDIPPTFLKQVVSSGGKLSQYQPTTQSSGLGLFNISSGSAPNDDVCIANRQPVSGDFKRFLENHPDMDFYEAKRKFKEEQKAKQRMRQGPKIGH